MAAMHLRDDSVFCLLVSHMNCFNMLKKHLVACLVGLAVSTTAIANDRFSVFYIGHSLMSDIPAMTRTLVESDRGSRFSLRQQEIPGAPLRWQWEAKDRNDQFEPHFGGRYDIHLSQGQFDTLVLTDSVPRGGPGMEAETVDYLGRIADFARQHRPDIRIYYYSTWHFLTSGTPNNSPYDKDAPNRNLKWRERIDADAKMWERIVNKVNAARPGAPPIKIIPGGTVLAALSDAIDDGQFTEWKSIRDLFSDDIHTNHYGKYAVALAHYAVLTGKSPVGLTSNLKDLWGRPYWNHKTWDGKIYPPMHPDTVKKMQEIVANTISTQPR